MQEFLYGRPKRSDGLYDVPSAGNGMSGVRREDLNVQGFLVREVGMTENTPRTQVVTEYSDRLQAADNHLYERTGSRGEIAFGQWAIQATPEEVIAFGTHAFGQELQGFRVSASVDRSNGNLLYLFEALPKNA